jgi:tetratricopeptide (TPR) repeat protein
VPPRILQLLLFLVLSSADDDAEARRLFELGDYPAAERAIGRALDRLPPEARAERALRLALRAELRALQGVGDAALRDVKDALGLDMSPAVRRSAVFVYQRVHRHAEALPHIEALLERFPGDGPLRLARGIARGRLGRLEEAVPDLLAGLDIPGAGRPARFELALVLSKLGRTAEALERLREILEDDPHDAEACYQASRQLLRLRRPGAARLAASVMKYFEALREAEGASSRADHLVFEGKATEAALERAQKWERLQRHDRVLAEISRARAAGSREAEGHLEAFWLRQGWKKAPSAEDLERALASAVASGGDEAADRAARLLLALEPRSIAALRRLAARTEDPSLVVPHLHYLKRLAEADPADPRWKNALAAARRAWKADG